MPRTSYDVIVVGAGPAGSTAAFECAARGLQTLIVDRAEFPRDKPCGGGVMVRTARALPVDITPVIERTAFTARLVRRNGRTDAITSSVPLCHMTRRTRLDAFLLEAARRRGATVMEKSAVRTMEGREDGVQVATDSGRFVASVVVGADGVNGVTARLSGMRPDVMKAVALEARLVLPDGVPAEWQRAGAVYSIGCPGGYGWVFPKEDHLNVGVAGWERIAPTLRRRLHEFTKACGFDPALLDGERGYRIPFRRKGSPLVSGRTMLVGDAGGLADPLTGDGIYSAVVSGKEAAVAAERFLSGAEADLSGYERSMKAGLAESERIALQMHDLVHLGMDQFFWSVARVPILWRACCAIARGDFTYKSAKDRLGPLGALMDLSSGLIRSARAVSLAASARV
jgi:geranylgeranyl reductase family protein